jgi:hypothetical protein
VGLSGLEPLTSALSGQRSNRLSYRPAGRGANGQKCWQSVRFASGELPLVSTFSREFDARARQARTARLADGRSVTQLGSDRTVSLRPG